MTSPNFTLRWAINADERRQAGRFLARTVKDQRAYISHGEVQQGLSPDGASWASDLEARLVEEFAREDVPRSVALAQMNGATIAIASIWWEMEAPAPYAVLADLAVAPGARDLGVGAALVRLVEAQARQRGLGWVFLESGLFNERAHGFFEREGFHALSKVFVKKLG